MSKAEARRQRMTQGELLAMPNPVPNMPSEPAQSPTDALGFKSLGALIAAQRERAMSVTVSDEQLAEWYGAQLAQQEEYVAKLVHALEQAGADKRLEDPESPLWKQRWLLEARLHYATETLALLRERGHILVCPNHGLSGIPSDLAEPLSLHGLLNGEGALAWNRYCEACSRDNIQITAAQLHRRYAK